MNNSHTATNNDALSAILLPPQLGQNPRRLQLNATNFSCVEAPQMTHLDFAIINLRGDCPQGEILTVEYLVNEFKKAGLEAGNGDSFRSF